MEGLAGRPLEAFSVLFSGRSSVGDRCTRRVATAPRVNVRFHRSRLRLRHLRNASLVYLSPLYLSSLYLSPLYLSPLYLSPLYLSLCLPLCLTR